MEMSAVPEPFSYDSALVGRMIRVLRISPACGADSIHLSLSTQALDDDTPFLALSYVWGSPEANETVICNEKTLRITENLRAALWQMREDGRTGYVWADAICINQGDLREKTEQVRLMTYIYGRAETVLVWLGKGEEHDEEGYNLMVGLCEPAKALETWSLGQVYTAHSEHEDAWTAMVNLLRRPWFWRAWVVQEYLMARKRIFQSGNLIMAPDTLFAIQARLSHNLNLLHFIQLLYPPSKSRFLFAPFFNFAEWNRGIELSTLLTSGGALESSDKRDRIFAFVGLSSDTDLSLINYGLSLPDILITVAIETTQRRLESNQPWLTLDTLCLLNSPSGVDNLPSWVPTYDLSTSFRSLTLIFPLESRLDTTPQVELTRNNTMLILGRIFDRVSKIIANDLLDQTKFPEPGSAELAEHIKRPLSWELSTRGLAESIPTYPTGEDLQEAYLRSLVFNSADFYEKAASDIQESFNAWMKFLALDVVFIENHSGTFVPESFEDILSRLNGLAPAIDWRLELESVPAVSDDSMWDELGKYMDPWSLTRTPFVKPIGYFSVLRRYFASELGYLGWVPRSAQEGDQICAFCGCRFPFVIRPKGNGFELVGACYMHGIMEGEAIKLPNTEGDERDVIITLV